MTIFSQSIAYRVTQYVQVNPPTVSKLLFCGSTAHISERCILLIFWFLMIYVKKNKKQTSWWVLSFSFPYMTSVFFRRRFWKIYSHPYHWVYKLNQIKSTLIWKIFNLNLIFGGIDCFYKLLLHFTFFIAPLKKLARLFVRTNLNSVYTRVYVLCLVWLVLI